jgi:ribosomal protein S18 acetylase RimI-like enzyme
MPPASKPWEWQMITTTYLEISDISLLRLPSDRSNGDKQVHLEPAAGPELCVSMYAAVGKNYHWDIYRVGWTMLHWSRYFHRSDIEISFICDAGDRQIGYLELQMHPDTSVEIVNFGLRPEFIGQGFGRGALETAVRRGFALASSGVWLHTCSLDHPAALKNYFACGFRFVREEVTDYIRLDPMPASGDVKMEQS